MIQEPVRTIQDVKYVQATAKGFDFDRKEVICNDMYGHYGDESRPKKPKNEFRLSYDKLVLGVGTKSNTFGVPGLESTEENDTHNPTGTNK